MDAIRREDINLTPRLPVLDSSKVEVRVSRIGVASSSPELKKTLPSTLVDGKRGVVEAQKVESRRDDRGPHLGPVGRALGEDHAVDAGVGTVDVVEADGARDLAVAVRARKDVGANADEGQQLVLLIGM